MIELLNLLKNNGLKLHNEKTEKNYMHFECDVMAKPGSKKESVLINSLGILEIKTHSRPVEGEANKSIVEMVSKFLGISKSNIEIIRGDKSKSKRIKILVEITANKSKKYYLEKFTLISKDLV